ncbi:spliceosome-associated protein 49-like [Wolffia australiana]
MGRNPMCTVFVGNLDEKVTDKILYEILIQVGHLVDLYMPMDKETNRHRGFAFAEFENEEIANYAVKLFSGTVRLCNRTLRFAISGHDKPSINNGAQSNSQYSSRFPFGHEREADPQDYEMTNADPYDPRRRSPHRRRL